MNFYFHTNKKHDMFNDYFKRSSICDKPTMGPTFIKAIVSDLFSASIQVCPSIRYLVIYFCAQLTYISQMFGHSRMTFDALMCFAANTNSLLKITWMDLFLRPLSMHRLILKKLFYEKFSIEWINYFNKPPSLSLRHPSAVTFPRTIKPLYGEKI